MKRNHRGNWNRSAGWKCGCQKIHQKNGGLRAVHRSPTAPHARAGEIVGGGPGRDGPGSWGAGVLSGRRGAGSLGAARWIGFGRTLVKRAGVGRGNRVPDRQIHLARGLRSGESDLCRAHDRTQPAGAEKFADQFLAVPAEPRACAAGVVQCTGRTSRSRLSENAVGARRRPHAADPSWSTSCSHWWWRLRCISCSRRRTRS